MTRRPGDVLVAHLHAMRTRARFVLAIRYWVVSAGPALVAGHALAAARGADTVQTLTVLSLSLASSLVVAIAAAMRRAPTLSDTAAIVDRRQRLESRAATALQFAAHEDPVSLLVVRDATVRLGACEPAAVFPVELPHRWPWMLGGAAAASMLVALTLGGAAGSRPTGGAGAGVGAAGGTAQTRSSNGSPEVVSSPPAATPVERPGPGAVAPRDSVAAADMPDNRSTTATPGRTGDDRERASTASRATSPPGLANRAPADASGASSGSSPSTGGPAAAGARSSGPAGAAASVMSGGGGAGAGTARSVAKGAGGIKGGTLASPNPDASLAATAASMPRGSARYRAEWERGQAAIARERVPPALRKYVRDYFDAIRPRQP